MAISVEMRIPPRCLVPGFDGAVFSREWKEALWARFYTAAPGRQRQSVERYSIVKRAWGPWSDATGSTRRPWQNGLSRPADDLVLQLTPGKPTWRSVQLATFPC